MGEVSKPHKRLDGDDPRIEAIFRAMAYVPHALYDEILKLGEYAVGEIIEEQNGLIEQLEAMRTALWEIADRPVEEDQKNAWTREMQACARDALNPASSPERGESDC